MSFTQELDQVLAENDSRSPWWKHPWLLVVCALMLVTGGYFLLSGSGDGASALDTSAVPVTAEVGVRSIANVVVASGRLRPIKIVEVGAQVSGQLHKLHVRAGDPVSQGDIVAEIDATVQANIVAAAHSQLESLQAHLPPTRAYIELAEATLAREQRLMQEQATNQVALDQARTNLITQRSALIQLESQIKQQKALIASEEAKLNYSTIFAPISGVVVSAGMSEGQTLNAMQITPVILRIADLSRMVVEAQVPEANIGKLTRGAGVSFSTLGGGTRRWRGTLQRIIPEAADSSSVINYTALFEVENTDGDLLPSMTAQVFFELTEPREVLAVPVSVLREFGEAIPGGGRTAIVQVVTGDHVIEAREIAVGEIGNTHAEVLAGLKEGDQVVSPSSRHSE